MPIYYSQPLGDLQVRLAHSDPECYDSSHLNLLFLFFRAATISPTAALSDIAEALWRSMVERGCIQCYEKGPVLASALAFICSHGQGSGNRADVSSSGSGLTKDVKVHQR